jgi:Zn-finger nucleic acid-binding protein
MLLKFDRVRHHNIRSVGLEGRLPAEAALRRRSVVFCSGCGNGLQEIRFLGVAIDMCPGCGGVWLEDGRLKELIDASRGGLPPRSVENVTRFRPSYHLSADEKNRIVKCPWCIGVLRPVNYTTSSGVAIYRCRNDHGVWVPRGNLERLLLFLNVWDSYFKQARGTFAQLAHYEKRRFLRRLSAS